MNKERRQKIKDLIATIADTVDEMTELEETIGGIGLDIEEVKDEEDDALGNMPEGLQDSDRGQAMQEAIDTMGDAYDLADEAKTRVANSIDDLVNCSNKLKELLIKK